MELERWTEASVAFRQALEIDSDYPEAAFSLGWIMLLHGNFGEGWPGYEARRRFKGTIWTKLNGPEWRGESLQGKRLLLYGEQANGDSFQFVRFAGVAAAMGAEVILGVWAPLAELFRAMEGDPVVIRHGDRTPPYDFHAPFMSAPFILKMEEKDIPRRVPYLRAEPERVAAWAKRLPQGVFRIGVAWQGSKADPARALPLSALAPLSRVPGVTLISLQKTAGLEQLANLPQGMVVETLGSDFDAGPDAFLDSAAVMMNLDLIVSIDTGLAHLAGALGRPLWILLKHVPEWRWMLDRSDSPWYPTARLFRQKEPGDWSAIVEEAAGELERLVGARGPRDDNSAI